MKSYNSLEAMRRDPSLDVMILNHATNQIKELQKEFPGETFADFNVSIGGLYYVVENELELHSLLSSIPQHSETGEYLFDGIEKFGNEEQWYMFAYIVTNDSGGPCYYISKKLYESLSSKLGEINANNTH